MELHRLAEKVPNAPEVVFVAIWAQGQLHGVVLFLKGQYANRLAAICYQQIGVQANFSTMSRKSTLCDTA